MNMDAAVFACRFTGIAGILLSIFLGFTSGWDLFFYGILFSAFWFCLSWYFKRPNKENKN
ncbi:hypothetical protein SAMN04487866_10270 [Thermoactinomyces sp. DSM 45891]|uniref:hypothetical protein n=1 Tax=Thermoactinomyces sp. DSM 45891 TaxID=1761907 RepID=UPI00089B73CB|nr:hypothetical protein [Thermoactinomyces sp. DSM 45891]SDY16069.1 hypothetical protein SAMN05444416_102166 [Thermoactinomyces sp. DSM 45892]SFX18698.1 hypothetical protein SAMN04487866_10270 [Thermoactinomyces sp. DSM 45891]